MSDLPSASALANSAAQLPVSWYFDPAIHALEMELLFRQGPGYVGHEAMVPNPGDYHVLDWMDKGRVLVRGEGGVELLSNVCRHRQATLLQGRGNARNIVCPLHRWTYGLDGTLLGAPHFPSNPCLNLGRTPIKAWNRMLFTGPRDPAQDLARLGVAADLDFSGFVFDRVEVDEYQCNWKTFIEVYVELYHVEPFHPGLGNFVDCDTLGWEYGDWHNVQMVGIKEGLSRPGSQVYRRWHQAVLDFDRGATPRHGALWLTYYPNVMIEWYPHALVVSTIIPRGPEACTNVVEFYYPEEIALFEPEFIEAERAAYRETALEDIIICERMTEGRRALYRRGDDEVGPYQSPMEDGMMHFHEFLRRHIEPRL